MITIFRVPLRGCFLSYLSSHISSLEGVILIIPEHLACFVEAIQCVKCYSFASYKCNDSSNIVIAGFLLADIPVHCLEHDGNVAVFVHEGHGTVQCNVNNICNLVPNLSENCAIESILGREHSNPEISVAAPIDLHIYYCQWVEKVFASIVMKGGKHIIVSQNNALLAQLDAYLAKYNIGLTYNHTVLSHPLMVFLIGVLDSIIVGEEAPFYSGNQNDNLLNELILQLTSNFNSAIVIEGVENITKENFPIEIKSVLSAIKCSSAMEYNGEIIQLLSKKNFLRKSSKDKKITCVNLREAPLISQDYTAVVFEQLLNTLSTQADILLFFNLIYRGNLIIISEFGSVKSGMILAVEQLLMKCCCAKQIKFIEEKKEEMVVCSSRTSIVLEQCHLPKYLSASMIHCLVTNPYLFYVFYVLDIKENIDNLPNVKFGVLVHYIFDYYCKHGDVYDYSQECEEFPYLTSIWHSKIKLMLDHYILLDEKRRKSLNKVDSEVKLVYSIAGQLIKVICDRIEYLENGNLVVVEYKTGVTPIMKSVSTGLSPQLLLNAVGAQIVYDKKVERIECWDVKHDGIKVRSVTNVEECIDNALMGIEKLIISLERFDFYANYSTFHPNIVRLFKC